MDLSATCFHAAALSDADAGAAAHAAAHAVAHASADAVAHAAAAHADLAAAHADLSAADAHATHAATIASAHSLTLGSSPFMARTCISWTREMASRLPSVIVSSPDSPRNHAQK